MFELENSLQSSHKKGIMVSFENESIMRDIITVIDDDTYNITAIHGMDELSQELFIRNKTSLVILERSSINGQVNIFDKYLKMMNINIPIVVVIDSDLIAKDRSGKMNPAHHYLINRHSTIKQLPNLLKSVLENV